MRFGLLYEAQRAFQGNDVDWNTLYKETLDSVSWPTKWALMLSGLWNTTSWWASPVRHARRFSLAR